MWPEWHGFSMLILGWLTWGSALFAKVFRVQADFEIWDLLPDYVKGMKIQHMLNLGDANVFFRGLSWLATLSATVTVLYWVWNFSELDAQDQLGYTVVYLFGINASVTLNRLIQQRAVSDAVNMSATAQHDLCVVTTFLGIISLLLSFGVYRTLKPSHFFLLNAGSSLGIISALGPGVIPETEKLNPIDSLRGFAERAEKKAEKDDEAAARKSTERRRRGDRGARRRRGADDEVSEPEPLPIPPVPEDEPVPDLHVDLGLASLLAGPAGRSEEEGTAKARVRSRSPADGRDATQETDPAVSGR